MLLENRAETSFTGYKPAFKVARFIEQRPVPSWEKALHFLLDNYPQTQAGRLRYVIDGSTAVKLHVPQRQPDPIDVDLITTSQTLAFEFANSRLFDAKFVQQWLAARGIVRATGSGHFWEMVDKLDFQGREVLVLNRPALAASKFLPYYGRMPRRSDERDLFLLGIPIAGKSQAETILAGCLVF